MEVWITWLATILFGYFAITSLYAGLKRYKKDEEREFDDPFLYGFEFMGLFFAFVSWVSEKLVPQKYQLLVFRIIALSTFLLMVGVICAFWIFSS